MYSERMNRQVILITHQPAFADVAELKFSVTKNSFGESEVTVDGGIHHGWTDLQ
jgi:DNA repair exonuclease SbcCD ATPase subunit